MLEDKIQKAIKPIISIYSQIELDIIEKLARHFNINEEFINTDYWYLEKLKELGGLNEETLKLLEQYTGKTRKELLMAMKDIGINSMSIEQLNIAKQKGLLDPELIKNSRNIQNIINQSYNDIEKTFLQINKTIQEQVRHTYTDIITQTYVKVNSGLYSYQEAILESLDELGNKGISVLKYQDKNGVTKSYDVVGTVRRDMLVATRGLAGKVNEEVIKESGWHIVRVTNHFGARTGDGQHDFTNHAWWQELQFFCWDYDGKATKEEKKLPDFMEHCNYGDVQGIVGINCKHLFTIWYGPLEKDKLDFTYDENEEQYNKTQQQRYLENGIRKWKRKQVIAKNVQDKDGYEKATKKTKEWQNRMNDFTKQNDLKREYTREHIKEYKSVTIKENNDIILTDDEQYAVNKYISSDFYIINEKLRNNLELNDTEIELCNNLDKALDKMPNYDGLVSRSLELAPEELKEFLNKHKVNNIVEYKVYTSTTKGNRYNNLSNVELYIQSKVGKNITEFNEKEQEILFKRKSKFIVKEIEKIKNTYHILLEDFE